MGTEPYVAWQTESGLVAIPESEALARRRGMAHQLGITDLVDRINDLEARIESLERRHR